MLRLGLIAAVEHFTCILGKYALENTQWDQDQADTVVLDILRWHAAEEMEHKSVAFDVYRVVGGSERMRKAALRRASLFLMVDVLVGTVHMLRRDGQLWNLGLWREGWRFLFAKDGILRLIWPAYKAYFRRGFHPWQQDTRSLLATWKAAQT